MPNNNTNVYTIHAARSYYEAASTFRPQQPAAINSIATPRPTPYGRSLPKIPANESMTIPSVPGYAKPFAHVTMGSGNLPPPPPPPSSTPPPPWSSRPSGELSQSTRLLETSLDDDNDVRARMDTAGSNYAQFIHSQLID